MRATPSTESLPSSPRALSSLPAATLWMYSWQRWRKKVKAGAEYFQTQGVYEPEKFIKFMEKAKQFGVPVQLGIIIPKNAGMLRYMNANVAGVHAPDEMIAEC